MRAHPLLETLEPRLLLDAAPALEEAPRVIDFAGLQWTVRADTPEALGENTYSDSPESVWVDEAGLHLRVRYDDGHWYAAEVVATQPTTYGTHRFYLTGRVDLLDSNITCALALAGDGAAAGIEFDADADAPETNATYIVDGVEQDWSIGLNGELSTQTIDWGADGVQFSSYHWHSTEPTTPAHVIEQWSYAGAAAPTIEDDLRIRLSLTLENALPPADGQEAEIVIAGVDIPNHAPTVETVDASADWLITGEALTVTAYGVADSDGTVELVEFYHDLDGDGDGSPDERLGSDGDGADGWTWSGAAAWEAGEHTVLARAVDDDGAYGRWTSLTVDVQAEPDVVAVIGAGEGAQGKSISFIDPDGTEVVVSLNRGQATLRLIREPVTITEETGGLQLNAGLRLVDITLADTTKKSTLKIKASGGSDGAVELGRLTGQTLLGKLQGPDVNLTGSGVAMTGDGYVKTLRLGNLTDGADIVMEGAAGRSGLAVQADNVGDGSVIDILQGPVRKMTFTGEFAGIIAAGVDRGADGLWFTDDDVVTGRVSVGTIRIAELPAGAMGESWGVLAGPAGAKVVLPKKTALQASAGSFETRILPGPDMQFAVRRVSGRIDSRTITGDALDVSRADYRVVITVRDDSGAVIQTRIVKIPRNGRWRASGVKAGATEACLVSLDALDAAKAGDPLSVDGRMVLAALTLD